LSDLSTVTQPKDSSCELLQVGNIGQIKQRRAQGCKPRAPGSLRFVCISDTHSRHRTLAADIPDGDVFIHAGDITMCGELDAFQDFNAFLKELPHKHKIVIAGNHDVTLQPEFYNKHFWRFHEKCYQDIGPKSLLTNCTYLEDSGVTIEGIKIYGSPWVSDYHDWAFNLTDEQRKTKFALIPKDIDVLITHGPPKGHRAKAGKGVDRGDPFLLSKVQKVKPLVHVFGHVHSGYGKVKDGDTMFLNVASLNDSYHPTNSPVVFDIMPPTIRGLAEEQTTK